MARVPIEEGYFRIPDDPDAAAACCSAASARTAARCSSRGGWCAPSACTRAPTTSSCRPAARSGPGRTATCRCSGRRTPTCPATASARSTSPRGRACRRSCSAVPTTSRSAWSSSSTSRPCNTNRDGDEVVIYRFRPVERRVACMRRGLRFEGVAVAGIGMVRVRHAARRAAHAPGARRRAARAARRRHDAGRRRRGVRRLHPAGVDDRHQGDEGARPHRPAGHAHRERVGHRAGRVPRGGVGGVVGPRRRGHGAVLRQVHRHGGAAAAAAAGAT